MGSSESLQQTEYLNNMVYENSSKDEEMLTFVASYTTTSTYDESTMKSADAHCCTKLERFSPDLTTIANPPNNDFKNNYENDLSSVDLNMFLPVVKLEKMTKTTIHKLTKHRDHQINLRSFIKQQRYKRRLSKENQRKGHRKSNVEESKKKILALQNFLEYYPISNQVTKYQKEVEFFKLKRKHRIDIDRYSTDRSDTSSICGSSVKSENFRPRRSLSAPIRFTYEHSKRKNNEAQIKKIDPNQSYTVEKICSVNLINNEIFFLVKWENYSTSHNTWESLDNVRNCEDLVLEYIEEELAGSEEELKQALIDIIEDQKETIEKYMKKSKREVMDEIQKKYDPFLFKCSQLVYMLVQKYVNYYGYFKKKFRHLVLLKHFSEMEKNQNDMHLLIKNEIMEKENQTFKVDIENDVDFTIFEPFDYTSENIIPQDYQISTDLKSGCACEKCDPKNKCCPNMMNGNFAYKEYKNGSRLRLYNTQMIIECNEQCKCDKNCLNRLTQQPRKHPLKIFKTDNGRGWGLKAVKSIPRGTFIIEYTGEIISQEESIKRGEMYDQIGKSYLFDLDFNEKNEALFTIDAAHYGNLARLINHSCEPNCRIWPVSTCNNNNSYLYRLCFFTTRQIKAGEELTFDYSGGAIINDDDKSENGDAQDNYIDDSVSFHHNIARKHRMLDMCKCGSSYCKGFVFL